jgi:hypothetical protein
MDEVDNGVLRVNEFLVPDLQEVVFARGAGGCAICCLVLAFSKIFRGRLLLQWIRYAMQNSFFVCHGRDGPEAEHESRAESDLVLESDGH